jgi:OTT_1508-like deaminase
MLSSVLARTPGEKSNHEKLSLELDALHKSFGDLENLVQGEATVTNAVKAVVKDAYKITVNGVSLPQRLRETGQLRIDSREIREINKVANYWRICLELAHLSRLYRSLFTGPRLETLPHYMPLQGVGQKRFVHAEIQMIAYYETSSSTSWPLALGSSKEACYLCHSFIKAHGSFYVSKAHRQIFNQWTVPDLSAYSIETLQRFRTALAAVDKVVLQGLKSARKARSIRQFPVQSSINLRKLELPTPSLTTITGSVGSGTRTFSEVFLGPHESAVLLDQAEVDPHIPRRAMIHQAEAIVQDKHEPNTFVVTSVSPKHVALGWLNVHMYVESPSSFSPASVHFEILPDQEVAKQNKECECFSIEDMSSREEVTVTPPDSVPCNDESALEFILMSKTRKAVRVKCIWHKVSSPPD